MENASKALIMAGSVLIGVMLFLIYNVALNATADAGAEVETRISAQNIQKFNAYFTVFEGRTNIQPQEIVAMYNYIQNFKANNQSDRLELIIDVSTFGTAMKRVHKPLNEQTATADDIAEYLSAFKEDKEYEYWYEFDGMHYDEETGIIDSIEFKGKCKRLPETPS